MPDDLTPCPRCFGTLVTRPDVPAPINAKPCPRCLTVPATEEIRRVAREWLGGPWPVGVHWSSQRGDGDRAVPLYLPAGRDLAVHVLAGRLEHVRLTQTGMCMVGVAGSEGFWLGNYQALYWPKDDPELRDAEAFAVVPALATIPADAPPDLRAARALALCLEATGGDDAR